MSHRKQVWGLGFVLLAACAPIVRELGDEPLAAGGRGGNSSAGTAAVLPSSGTSSGVAGGSEPTGGAPPEPECFTPKTRLDLARDPRGVGCICDTAAQYCVSDDSGAEPWSALLDCSTGRWQVATSPCQQECFSPTNRPELAVDLEVAGCACDTEPPECVLTEHDGRPWRVSLYCEEGHWVSAADGVCGDGTQADCRVNGVTYPHGARRIPSPFDCNECQCDDGGVRCNEGGCGDGPDECPADSTLRSICVQCGGRFPMDACGVFETACFPDGPCVGDDCGVACN